MRQARNKVKQCRHVVSSFGVPFAQFTILSTRCAVAPFMKEDQATLAGFTALHGKQRREIKATAILVDHFKVRELVLEVMFVPGNVTLRGDAVPTGVVEGVFEMPALPRCVDLAEQLLEPCEPAQRFRNKLWRANTMDVALVFLPELVLVR